jgi:hypothetical protein
LELCKGACSCSAVVLDGVERKLHTMMQQVHTLRHAKEKEEKRTKAAQREAYLKKQAAVAAQFEEKKRADKKRKYRDADLKAQDRKKFSRSAE